MSQARGHREIFLKTIKSLSVVPANYLSEWEILRVNKIPNIPFPHEPEEWNCDCKIENRQEIHKRCICRQHIDNYYSLQNKLSGNIIWIGTDCAKKFLGINSPDNTCLECGKYTRKNKTNLCKKCKGCCILKVGKHKGKIYHEIYENDTSYCNWVLNCQQPTGQIKSFQNWLERKQMSI